MFDRLVVALLVSCSAVSALADDPVKLAHDTTVKTWQSEGWPLMKRLCVDCHNEDTQEGELDLSLFESLEGQDTSSSMKRVLEMVRFGAMPPEDSELPSADERKKLVSALENALYSVSCDLDPRPGKVTARRLNRAEYNNTIRDLFLMDLKPANKFPSDEVGGGFDNNADVLSLSPTLIEKYFDAAEYVSSKVVVDPASIPKVDREIASDQIYIVGDTKTGRFNGRFLKRDSFAFVQVEAPFDGEYRLKLRGGSSKKEAKATTVALYDQNGLLLAKDELNYFGGGGGSDRFEERFRLHKGLNTIFIEPLEEKQELEPGKTKWKRFSSVGDEIKQSKKRGLKPLKPDDDLDLDEFAFMVREVEIDGPMKLPPDAYPPSQSKILRRHARLDRGRWRDVEDAARECLKPLMRRAFRGPVTNDEVKAYAKLAEQATDRGESYYRGIQIAVSAVLMSPRFLFRVEVPPENWKPSKNEVDVKLTPHQLATRISFFLWSSTPDERLLDEADRGRVVKNLESHVRRMIADPKSDALANQFAAQWLGLRNLEVHEADTDHFKGFDPKLLPAMQTETQLLFMHLVRNNRPVNELLTADYSFLNKGLAKHYGIDLDSNEFKKVSLSQTARRGILSHASVLTLTSNPNRTSPVKRGKWILQNVLGTPPPDPPPGVPELEETKTASKDASLRDQLEIHRASPTCASCHKVMDQLGFGLEQFDAIGQFRKTENGKPVDASGVLPGGRNFNGAAELSDVLGKSERDAFAKTAIERMLTFAIGRELTPADRCTIDEIAAKTQKNGYRLTDLILEVTRSRPFQYYQLPNSR